MKLMSLEIKNLVLGYEDKIIVNNIDLSIPKGEITMLIGANGCGKSTLLSGMSRLLIPKEGDVLLEGVSIHDYKAKDLAKKLAIFFIRRTKTACMDSNGFNSKYRYTFT